MSEQLQLDFFTVAYDFWDEAQRAAQSSLVLAAKAGAALLQAKAETQHGEFQKKIEKDGRIGYRKARQCMQVAKGYPELLNGNWQPVAILDFSQAVMLLSADDETKTIVQEKLDAGESVTKREIEELKARAKAFEYKAGSIQDELFRTKQAAQDEADRLKKKLSQERALNKATDREAELARRLSEAEAKAARMESELSSAKAQIEGGLGVAELLEPKVVIQEDTESKRELERVRKQLEEKTRLHEMAARQAGEFQTEMHKATARLATMEDKLKDVEDTGVVLTVFARQVVEWKNQLGFVAAVLQQKEQTLESSTFQACREVADRMKWIIDLQDNRQALD